MSNMNSPGNQGKKHSTTHLNQGRQIPEEQKISSEEKSLSPEQSEEVRKRANARTEAQANSIDGKAGHGGHSSKNHMSHVKAGGRDDPGGGVKAGRRH